MSSLFAPLVTKWYQFSLLRHLDMIHKKMSKFLPDFSTNVANKALCLTRDDLEAFKVPHLKPWKIQTF